MNIQTIGQLRPHPDVPKWLVSAPIAIQYFDGLRLTFTLDCLQNADEHEAKAAIESFLSLAPTDRLAASPYVHRNYLLIADLVDDDALGCQIVSETHVWEHVHPTEIFVSRRNRRERAIYIQIAAECAWEPEHGLQIVYRRGHELSRVSAQDGHLTHTDACDLPEDQDKIA